MELNKRVFCLQDLLLPLVYHIPVGILSYYVNIIPPFPFYTYRPLILHFCAYICVCMCMAMFLSQNHLDSQ